jgi:glucose-6-phosphate dehydrogenase assembly protein OpcA
VAETLSVQPSEQVRLPDVADIEKELTRFWRESSTDERAVVRACTHNLIVVCEDDDDLAAATNSVAELMEQHPGRALVVSTVDPEQEGDSGPGLDAFVSTHCHLAAGGRLVCGEQVTLKARGEASVELVPKTVLQLLEGSCPVYVWWRRSRYAADPLWAPFAEVADRCIVSSSGASDPLRILQDLAELASVDAWNCAPGDLAWIRLDAWRQVIAQEFDPEFALALLDRISAVEIGAGGPASKRGTTAATAYLVGWLASRLGWGLDQARGVWRRPDGGEVEVRIVPAPVVHSRLVSSVTIVTSTESGRETVFTAERAAPGQDVIRLRVETEGTCPLPYTVKIERRDDVPLLSGELARGSRDPVFREALDAAARWAMARELSG